MKRQICIALCIASIGIYNLYSCFIYTLAVNMNRITGIYVKRSSLRRIDILACCKHSRRNGSHPVSIYIDINIICINVYMSCMIITLLLCHDGATY